MRIHSEGKEVAPQSRPRRRRGTVSLWTVELGRLVDSNRALVRNRVFHENKRPVDGPVHHADAGAERAAVVERVVLAAFKVDERAANGAVRTVVPGGRIGCRSAKDAERCSLAQPGSKVATVNGVEAGRPGKVEPPKAGHQAGVGI